MRKTKKKSNGVSPTPYRTDPAKWQEPVNGAALLDEIRDTFERYVVLPPHASVALALWTVHTYAVDAAYLSPFLGIMSPEKRCGKTTLLALLNAMCYRAFIANHITPASLFRLIEKWRPTVLIDEADTYLIGNTEMRGVLNGNTRNATVVRCVGDDHDPTAFPLFAAKAIAMIGELPETLLDRSIPLPMRRKAAGEVVERFREDAVLVAVEPLRMKAMRWSSDFIEVLRASDPDLPTELNDRARDNWRPLIAIADAAGGRWPVTARVSALALSAREERAISEGVQLLIDIREIFDSCDDGFLASWRIVEKLARMEDRPWPDYNRRESITTAQLARLLQPFSVRPTKVREGLTTIRGYYRRDFEDAFARYIPAFVDDGDATEGADPIEPEQAEQPEHGFGCDGDCTG